MIIIIIILPKLNEGCEPPQANCAVNWTCPYLAHLLARLHAWSQMEDRYGLGVLRRQEGDETFDLLFDGAYMRWWREEKRGMNYPCVPNEYLLVPTTAPHVPAFITTQTQYFASMSFHGSNAIASILFLLKVKTRVRNNFVEMGRREEGGAGKERRKGGGGGKGLQTSLGFQTLTSLSLEALHISSPSETKTLTSLVWSSMYPWAWKLPDS